MSKAAWSITSTKRKAETRTSTPAASKRRRVGAIEGNEDATHSRSQPTLTQAGWMTPVGDRIDVPDMDMLGARQSRQAPARVRPRRSLKKRNSTLTQMQFFDLPPQDDLEFDDAMIGPDISLRAGPPQIDGAYDSPRKPRRRREVATPNATTTKESTNDSQGEYRPSKKKRKSEHTPPPTKRTSKRLAKSEVLSDPVRNFDYFAEALGSASQGLLRDDDGVRASNNPLEIKDSTEDGDATMLDVQPTSRSSALPQTPKKKITVVLSSQSPASLQTRTKRTDRKATTTPTKSQRTPLAERSINALRQVSPTLSSEKMQRPTRRSPRSKMVVLKLPRRKPTAPPTRVDDSQTNLWSLPTSSSPIANRKSPPMPPPPGVVRPSEDELEIPATSQVQLQQSFPFGSQDSLPSLSGIFGLCTSRSQEAVITRSDHHNHDSNEGVAVKDFAAVPAKSEIELEQDVLSVPSSPSRAIPELDEDLTGDVQPNNDMDDVDDMDLGSPIANDTQFNVQVHHRVSSPILPGQPQMPMPNVAKPATPALSLSDKEDVPTPVPDLPDLETIRSPQTPASAPRSITTPAARVLDPMQLELDNEDDDNGEDELTLSDPPSFVHPASIRHTDTQVPLNGTSNGSSSPSRRRTRLATQRSGHPASMPHPSQMSTQEPTQAYLLPSSLPQSVPLERSAKADRITIKDSSSASVPLSQIPLYLRSSQAGPDNAAGLYEDDSWDAAGDFDLDPSSAPQPKVPGPQAIPVQPTPSRAPRPSTQEVDLLEAVTTPPSKSSEPAIRHPAENTHADAPPHAEPRKDVSAPPKRPETRTRRQRSEESAAAPGRQSRRSPSSSPVPLLYRVCSPLQGHHSLIPGYNNDTQSNLTQNGHISAAYIHRLRDAGELPKFYTPPLYQVPGYTRR